MMKINYFSQIVFFNFFKKMIFSSIFPDLKAKTPLRDKASISTKTLFGNMKVKPNKTSINTKNRFPLQFDDNKGFF